MDLLLLNVINRQPKDDWKPGDICYYWKLGQVHKAVFCRWTVGDHSWAAVFDICPAAEACDEDGYDYSTERVTYDDLFDNEDTLINLVTEAFRQELHTRKSRIRDTVYGMPPICLNCGNNSDTIVCHADHDRSNPVLQTHLAHCKDWKSEDDQGIDIGEFR